jgi:hypothetical protein
MWQAKHEALFPTLTRNAVWEVWRNVNAWQSWDVDIEFAHLTGDFEPGARFMLKPKGGPHLSIELIAVEAGRSFTDVTHLPLARLFDVHEMEETPQGLLIKSRMYVTGPLAWLWRRLVARGVAAGVPKQMRALAQRAEALSAAQERHAA